MSGWSPQETTMRVVEKNVVMRASRLRLYSRSSPPPPPPPSPPGKMRRKAQQLKGVSDALQRSSSPHARWCCRTQWPWQSLLTCPTHSDVEKRDSTQSTHNSAPSDSNHTHHHLASFCACAVCVCVRVRVCACACVRVCASVCV